MNGKRPGQTLIEVTMATLVAATTAMAIFSVTLSSRYADVRADKRDAAAMVFRHAQQVLQNYVSAVPAEAQYVPNNGLWAADTSGLWALQAGNHDISSLLTNTTLNGGTFRYTVADIPNCGGAALVCKEVRFNLTYTD